ncbi:MAG: hypothetical protein QXS54_10400 [Candidatus Methanomethylicaceae archaeon]
MQPNTLSVDEFFKTHYSHLLHYCCSRWNGSGQDILHQVYLILRERYPRINFSLFMTTCHEAARALGLHRRELPLYENIPQQTTQEEKEDPRMERLCQVLAQKPTDPEEILTRKDMVSRLRAEYYGQLSFAFTEEGQ